jgi:hypothetical protein
VNVLTVPRTLAALEYKAVRYPAQLLETRLVAVRLSDDNPLRLGFERLLGTLDAAAGSLFADESLVARGRFLTRRVEMLEKAVALEAKAAERQATADAELRAQTKKLEQEKEQVQAEHEREAARLRAERDAEAKAIERKAAARERADADAIVESSQSIIAVERDRLDAEKARIEARVETQTAAPKAQLKAARKSGQEAVAKRADADRLTLVREAEKANNTQ